MIEQVIPKSVWSPPEIVEKAISDDEREWVPSATPGVWMRPLQFDTVNGSWVNITRMRTEGFVSRHRHPAPVHGYVIKGSWRYLERDWVASEGSYLVRAIVDINGNRVEISLFRILPEKGTDG